MCVSVCASSVARVYKQTSCYFVEMKILRAPRLIRCDFLAASDTGHRESGRRLCYSLAQPGAFLSLASFDYTQGWKIIFFFEESLLNVLDVQIIYGKL
jgi:hypothetical protein